MNYLISHEANRAVNPGTRVASSKSKNNSAAPKLMKVLLVEDSALLRQALTEILSGCPGLSFEGAASTQAGAISLLQQKQFDLIIVDIELAQGNGFEVIKATLADSYPFKRPVCVILTNHAHKEYREQARKLEVEHFFDKSMDFELAIETIETESIKFTDSTH